MEKFLELISNLPEKLYSFGKQDDEVILKAENALGVKFGKELRFYLSHFGAVAYESVEFTGLGMRDSSYINIVRCTKLARDDWNIPNNLVVIEDLGDGLFELCDENDRMFFIAEGSAPKDDGISLLEYLSQRLLNA